MAKRAGWRAGRTRWTLALGAWVLGLLLTSAAWGAPHSDEETVRVRIGANVRGDLEWDFWPTLPETTTRPGETAQVTYRVRNRSAKALYGKAFHGTTPAEGQSFVEIIGCFCDQAIRLEPGEERELTLLFRIGWDIPDHLRDLLVEYDFWPASDEEIQESRGSSAAAPKF